MNSNVALPIPNQDERLMAALAHISIALPFMGVVAPIVIWVTQKDKSSYITVQALQALALQLGMILSWFVGIGCYACSVFGLIMLGALASANEQAQSVGPIFGVGFLIPLLVFGAMFLMGFAFIGYGVYGAVSAFQGKPFRYFLIGKRVERFLQER